MITVAELGSALAREPQIKFVDELGCLEGLLTCFLAKISGCHGVELSVGDLDEAVEHARVTRTPAL